MEIGSWVHYWVFCKMHVKFYMTWLIQWPISNIGHWLILINSEITGLVLARIQFILSPRYWFRGIGDVNYIKDYLNRVSLIIYSKFLLQKPFCSHFFYFVLYKDPK